MKKILVFLLMVLFSIDLYAKDPLYTCSSDMVKKYIKDCDAVQALKIVNECNGKDSNPTNIVFDYLVENGCRTLHFLAYCTRNKDTKLDLAQVEAIKKIILGDYIRNVNSIAEDSKKHMTLNAICNDPANTRETKNKYNSVEFAVKYANVNYLRAVADLYTEQKEVPFTVLNTEEYQKMMKNTQVSTNSSIETDNRLLVINRRPIDPSYFYFCPAVKTMYYKKYIDQRVESTRTLMAVKDNRKKKVEDKRDPKQYLTKYDCSDLASVTALLPGIIQGDKLRVTKNRKLKDSEKKLLAELVRVEKYSNSNFDSLMAKINKDAVVDPYNNVTLFNTDLAEFFDSRNTVYHKITPEEGITVQQAPKGADQEYLVI
jgi:hypothetical protein